MTLWQKYQRTLQMPVHLIKLEELILDFEAQIRPLLDFIGVPWDDSVNSYAETALKRICVQTPSYHQVVEQINARGLYRWRRYERQMAGVIDSLEPFVDYFGYDRD